MDALNIFNSLPAGNRHSLSIIGTLLFISLIFFIFLKTKGIKVMSVRFKITDAISSNDLSELLKILKKLPREVFDDSSVRSKVVNFLDNAISKENLPAIFDVYTSLKGSGRKETAEIFEKVFSNFYFINFIKKNDKKLDEFKDCLELQPIFYFKKVYFTILCKLREQEETGQDFLLAEIKRIKILLG